MWWCVVQQCMLVFAMKMVLSSYGVMLRLLEGFPCVYYSSSCILNIEVVKLLTFPVSDSTTSIFNRRIILDLKYEDRNISDKENKMITKLG